MIVCGKCGQRPKEEFERIEPAKVIDDFGRPVLYAKHSRCGLKTVKRTAQAAGKRRIISAAH